MYYLIKKCVYMFCFCGTILCEDALLTVHHISFEHCKEKACQLEKKIQRHRVLNACVTGVATAYTMYSVWHFLMSDSLVSHKDTLQSHGIPEKVLAPTGFVWARNMIYEPMRNLAIVCARHMCARWLLAYMMPDFSVKTFVKEYVSYQEHTNELRVFVDRISQNRNFLYDKRTVSLAKMHLQKMIDKIGCVMIYVLAQSQQSSVARNSIEEFVQLTIQSLERELVLFCKNYADNPVTAYQNIISAITDLLASSIKYTVCIMSDELICVRSQG